MLISSSIENFLLRSGLLEYILICQDLLTMSSMFLVLPPFLARTRIPVTFTGQYSHFSLHHHQFSFTTTCSQIPLKFSEWAVEATIFSVAIPLSQSDVPLCLMMVIGLHWALTMVLWKLLILSLPPWFHDQPDCQSRQSGFYSSTEDISLSWKPSKETFIFGIISLRQQRFSSRIDGSTMVIASLSHDGSMIICAAQHSAKEWYENMYIIHITTDNPTIHSLSTSSRIFRYSGRRFPLQRSVGFSPDGQYAAAFDTQQAFIWSCTSFQLIAHYSIEHPHNWFLNTNRPLTMPTLASPNDVIIMPFPEHSGSIGSTS